MSIADIQQVAARWGLTDQDAGWDGQYDLIADGVIDIFDIQQVANEWRQTCHVPVETVKYYTLGGRRVAMRKGSTAVTADSSGERAAELRRG